MHTDDKYLEIIPETKSTCGKSVEAMVVSVLQVGSPFTLEIPLGAISSIEKVGKSKKKEKKDALYGLELVCKVCCGTHCAVSSVDHFGCYV